MEEENKALLEEYKKEKEAEAASLAAAEEVEVEEPKKQRKPRKIHEYVCDSFLGFLKRKKDLAISRNQAKKLCALATKYNQALNTIADLCLVIAEYRKRKKLTRLDINCIENLCRVRFYSLIELNFQLYWEPPKSPPTKLDTEPPKVPETPKPEEQPKPAPNSHTLPAMSTAEEEGFPRFKEKTEPEPTYIELNSEKTEPSKEPTEETPRSKYDISLPTPKITEKSNIDPNLAFLSSDKSPEPEKPSEEPKKKQNKKRKR